MARIDRDFPHQVLLPIKPAGSISGGANGAGFFGSTERKP
jgi:hypothetical protein